VVVERGAQVKLLAAQELACDTANAETLTRALTQLRSTLPVKTPIVLGIPSTSVIVTTVSPLIPNPARSILGVQFELQQHLPFELAQAAWHYQWLNGHSTPARATRPIDARAVVLRRAQDDRAEQSRSAVVGAMKRSLLEERLTCCRRAGLSIRAVAINGLATLNAWWRDPSRRSTAEPTMLLHLIDDQTAEWILVTPTLLRVVPVTSSSADAFGQELGGSWEALRAESASPPQRVWVSGHTASWLKLQQVLTARGGVQVERSEESAVVSSSLDVPQPAGKFVTAIGLALQGMGLGRLRLNLLQDAQGREQARIIRHVATVTTALSIVVSVILGLTGVMELRHRRLRTLEALQQQERLYQTLRPDLRELLQRQQHLERRIQRLERLVGQSTMLTQLVAQTAQLLPDDVWLTKLEYSKSPLVGTATASQADGLEGLLEGRAKSFQALTQCTDRLKGMGGIGTVKPLSTNVTTDENTGKELVVFAVQFQRR
jgi:Tfp pilus assembly protein PilN